MFRPDTAKFSVSDLGLMDYVGSTAHAINDRGNIIGTLGVGSRRGFSPQSNYSFLWENGQMTDFGRSRAVLQINNSNHLAGIKYLPGFAADFSPLKVSPIFRGVGKWKSFLPKGAAAGTVATLNDAGQAAGQLFLDASQPNTFSPAIWYGDQFQLLEVPKPAISGVVKGMNDEGQTVGFLQEVVSESLYRTSAALWDKNGVTLLGSLPGAENHSEAVAINRKGCVLGIATFQWDSFWQSIQEAFNGEKPLKQQTVSFGGFLWDHGNLTALVGPEDSVAGIDLSKGYVARALNDSGAVVGRAANWDGEPVAFLWHDHAMVDLNALIPEGSGWMLTDARDLNNRNQIVGSGKYHGQSHAFLLTLT